MRKIKLVEFRKTKADKGPSGDPEFEYRTLGNLFLPLLYNNRMQTMEIGNLRPRFLRKLRVMQYGTKTQSINQVAKV